MLISGCHTAERENIRACAKKLDDVVIATRYGPSVTHIIVGDDHRRTVKGRKFVEISLKFRSTSRNYRWKMDCDYELDH